MPHWDCGLTKGALRLCRAYHKTNPNTSAATKTRARFAGDRPMTGWRSAFMAFHRGGNSGPGQPFVLDHTVRRTITVVMSSATGALPQNAQNDWLRASIISADEQFRYSRNTLTTRSCPNCSPAGDFASTTPSVAATNTSPTAIATRGAQRGG